MLIFIQSHGCHTINGKDVCNLCLQSLISLLQLQSFIFSDSQLALRFTSESLSDCVLGIKAYSYTSQALPIVDNVKKFAEHNTAFIVFSIMVGFLPSILEIFKAKFFPRDCEEFFMKLMSTAFQLHSNEKNERNDILSHLIKIKNVHKLHEVDMYSHTMTFLIDGLDTTATVISHCLLMVSFSFLIKKKKKSPSNLYLFSQLENLKLKKNCIVKY